MSLNDSFRWSGSAILLVLSMLAAPASAAPPRKRNAATVDDVARLREEATLKAAALPQAVKQRIETAKESVGIIRGSSGSGSGFLVAKGVLCTNAHVALAGMVKELKVQFVSAQDPNPASLPLQLLYLDCEADLALFAVDTPLPPLPLLEASKVRIGLPVALIGNPGEFRDDTALNTVTAGKYVELVTNMLGKSGNYMKTSAFAAGGNSGGPAICQATGAAFGVVTFRASVADGCVATCLPISVVAAALGKIGPPEKWKERSTVLTDMHAAILAHAILDGGSKQMSLQKVAGLAQEYWQMASERKRPRLVINDVAFEGHDGIVKLKANMDDRIKDAKRLVEGIKISPHVPQKDRVSLIEMVKSSEELATLISKPLRVKINAPELKTYFARIKDVSADIEKKSATVKKGLDDLNGK